MTSDPFNSFSKIAFRVEALPFYADSDGRSLELEEYVERGTLPDSHNEDWAAVIRSAGARGARVARLRLVSNPLSAYEDFEIAAGYRAGMRAGESIRVAQHGDVEVPFDFWSFDGEVIAEMRYDGAGNFLGREIRAASKSDLNLVEKFWSIYESSPQVTID